VHAPSTTTVVAGYRFREDPAARLTSPL
jgi:hypothetical protein